MGIGSAFFAFGLRKIRQQPFENTCSSKKETIFDGRDAKKAKIHKKARFPLAFIDKLC